MPGYLEQTLISPIEASYENVCVCVHDCVCMCVHVYVCFCMNISVSACNHLQLRLLN